MCRSRKGAWIEINNLQRRWLKFDVAPVRERGLKLKINNLNIITIYVAPVRERGLKYISPKQFSVFNGRSRKGAWIEILYMPFLAAVPVVAPVRERGLKWRNLTATLHHVDGRSRKGAWIEILQSACKNPANIVAPVRERGLKCLRIKQIRLHHQSLP